MALNMECGGAVPAENGAREEVMKETMKQQEHPVDRENGQQDDPTTLPVVQPPAPYGPNQDDPPVVHEVHRPGAKEHRPKP